MPPTGDSNRLMLVAFASLWPDFAQELSVAGVLPSAFPLSLRQLFSQPAGLAAEPVADVLLSLEGG
jgi:hypothetical protein